MENEETSEILLSEKKIVEIIAIHHKRDSLMIDAILDICKAQDAKTRNSLGRI